MVGRVVEEGGGWTREMTGKWGEVELVYGIRRQVGDLSKKSASKG
jgi:hypothetical protein